MSRTHKDVPTKHRSPKEQYDFLYNTVFEIFTDENGVVHYSRHELPGVKTKKRKHHDTEHHWMSTPSWWTRLTMNRPIRRYYHLLEHEAVRTPDLEELDIPDLKKKPHNYYW